MKFVDFALAITGWNAILLSTMRGAGVKLYYEAQRIT
jgi:hypothetical protein